MFASVDTSEIIEKLLLQGGVNGLLVLMIYKLLSRLANKHFERFENLVRATKRQNIKLSRMVRLGRHHGKQLDSIVAFNTRAEMPNNQFSTKNTNRALVEIAGMIGDIAEERGLTQDVTIERIKGFLSRRPTDSDVV